MSMRHAKFGTVFAALVGMLLFLGCQDEEATTGPQPHVHILESVQVEPATPNLMEGETVELSATPICVAGHELDLPVTWISADESVATVDDNGVVTAVLEGEAEISAETTTDDGTVTGSAGITVNRDGETVEATGGIVSYSTSFGDVILDIPEGAVAEATKISIRPSAADVAAGKSGLTSGAAFHFRPEGFRFQTAATLTIRYRQEGLSQETNEARLKLFHHQNGQWEEMSESRVDTEANSVTGQISGFSHYGVAESDLPAVAEIIVAGDVDNLLMIGETVQLTATLLDADGNVLEGRDVEWSSSDESVARVSDSGLVTALSRGEVEIAASSEGQKGKAGMGVGSGKGGLYAELVYLLRNEDGLPMMRDVAGETCQQPVSYTEVPGLTPVTNPVNGEDVWVLPLMGDTEVTTSDEDGEVEACDVQLEYQEYMHEVEIGRLNVGRSPDDVLARGLEEVYAKLDAAETLNLDHAGRLMPDTVPIDAPRENLAIEKELILTGQLGGYGLPQPTGMAGGYGFLDHAASALAGGADKFGEIGADLIVYYDRILNFPNEVAGGLTTITGDGDVGVEGREYLDYGRFSYDREATFPGCVFGYELVGEEMVPFEGTLMDIVFGGEALSADNIHGFAQRADDARAVILFEHDNVIVDIDRIGETSVCEEREIQ